MTTACGGTLTLAIRHCERNPVFVVFGRHAAMLDKGGGKKYSPTRMPSAIEAETALLETVRTLPSESQRAVLSYAMFLRHQEEARRLEADETAWDRHFNQPEKMARFAEWARQSLEQHPAEPLDDSRL